MFLLLIPSFNNIESLTALDNKFLLFLKEHNEELYSYLLDLRHSSMELSKDDYSKLILTLTPYLDDFLEDIFNIKNENQLLKNLATNFDIIFECRRKFIQRYALKQYENLHVNDKEFAELTATLRTILANDLTELNLSTHILDWLTNQDKYYKELDIAARYCSVMVGKHSKLSLFDIPRKVNPSNHIRDWRVDQLNQDIVLSFDYRDQEQKDIAKAQGHSRYCLYCHEQKKDSCSKGLNEEKKGCPLDQKISEMNKAYAQGFHLAALAIITIDNPLVAITGHRICNDCTKACIFQKQDPVNIPLIESNILNNILSLPYGVEIYYLLTWWNPLKITDYLPKPASNFNIMVAGLGPAGFAISYYLLHEGHNVTAIDGMRILPLDFDIHQPIKNWKDITKNLSIRIPAGFGGVTEYGITHRWDKNNLLLIRLILERASKFSYLGSTRLGSNITIEQVFAHGFDHLVLCLGAGRPKHLSDNGYFAKGIKNAADFLMQLNLGAAHNVGSMSNLQIRMPAAVYGCGLTAVDSAMELVNYYPKMVENFARIFDDNIFSKLNEEEAIIAREYLEHAALFAKAKSNAEKIAIIKNLGGVTVYYRKDIINSPAYRLNPEEIEQALALGIKFIDNTKIKNVAIDKFGSLEGITLSDNKKDSTNTSTSVRTLLLSLGTENNQFIDLLHNFDQETLFFKRQDRKISYLGDCNPKYHGSVVKALTSAKKAYKAISKSLSKDKMNSVVDRNIKTLLASKIENIVKIPNTNLGNINNSQKSILEITIKSPLAAINYKPGQFFRLQNYANNIANTMEPLALTPVNVDQVSGMITFFVDQIGATTKLCDTLQPGDMISLMGPTGQSSYIPHTKNVAIITESIGHILTLPLLQALHNNNCHITAFFGHDSDNPQLIWQDKLERYANQLYLYQHGELSRVLAEQKDNLQNIEYIYTFASNKLLAQLIDQKNNYFKTNVTILCSINVPMQCMMKGICGQCIQKIHNSNDYVFVCNNHELSIDQLDLQSLEQRQKFNSLFEKVKFFL